MPDGVIKLQGDCRDLLPTLPEKSINCCVTSPPYWGLRDYGVDGQIGLQGGQSLQENPTDTRNKRSVWTVATQPYSAAHFATFPEKLIEPCILAVCPEGGTVLDPFGGSGTTGRVAIKNRRNAILMELNPEYIGLQGERNSNVQINMF